MAVFIYFFFNEHSILEKPMKNQRCKSWRPEWRGITVYCFPITCTFSVHFSNSRCFFLVAVGIENTVRDITYQGANDVMSWHWLLVASFRHPRLRWHCTFFTAHFTDRDAIRRPSYLSCCKSGRLRLLHCPREGSPVQGSTRQGWCLLSFVFGAASADVVT